MADFDADNTDQYRALFQQCEHGCDTGSVFRATPGPFRCTPCLRVDTKDTVKMAARLADYVENFGKSHNSLLAALEADNTRRHRVHDGVALAEQSQSSEDDNDNRETICYKKGICIHTERGQQILCVAKF